jgi:glutamate/aspartate transport system substrate-binding protein
MKSIGPQSVEAAFMSTSSAGWRRQAASIVLAAALACGVAPVARSQDAVGVEQLTGTLKKIATTRTVTLGYRDASIPFSYLSPVGKPIGYSIDICLEIVGDIRAELGDDSIQVKYVAVDTQTRIPRVVDGTVDLDCGTTTNTAERRKQVAFSPIIFVSGTKLLVKQTSKLRSYGDLKGRIVAVTPASTNEAAIKALNAREGLAISILVVPGNRQAFEALIAAKADAWAGDDALLYATAAESKNPDDFIVLDQFLSYDPYGIMYRKDDPALDTLVKRSFERMAEERELARIYEQWFLRKLPSGRTLGLSMSPQLESIFESLGQPTE